MLPVIGTEPIKFSLANSKNSCSFSKNARPPSADSDKTDAITLYPITVEFDRLLRRQAQLKQFSNATTTTSNRSPLHSRQHTRSGRSSTSSARSTPTKTPRRTSPLYHDPTDVASILANLDATELLYATIIHYYASLCPKWITSGGTSLDSKPSTSEPEVESLDQIYRTLCTPGTRTLLLLADKNEIINNFVQQNPGDIASQLVSEELLQNGHPSSNGHEADVEDGETSDLECESKSTRPGKSTHQRDRQREFCCPSSGINSSMSEDCLTASLRTNDDGEPAHLPAARKYSEGGHSTGSWSTIKTSRSYRICKLMRGCSTGAISSGSLAAGGKGSAHGNGFPLGIKMGVKGGGGRGGSNGKNRPSHEEYSKKPTKKYLQEFDHFLEAALRRQQQFYRVFCQGHLGQQSGTSSSILDDHEELLQHLGIEQQIVGCVTFYKSYRLTGIKVIELALLSVLSQYQNCGIGSYLLRCVKESGQIGPYDAIRVKVPAGSAALKHFFITNDFTDDMILNASFDQLDSVSSDGEDQVDPVELGLQEVPDCAPEHHQVKLGGGHHGSSSLHHSISFEGSPTATPTRIMSKSKTILSLAGPSTTSPAWISLCYLPPFSVATSLRDPHRPTASTQHHFLSQYRSLITELDNHYVDELIEEANSIWRRDLLAAYRTQWSCVGRLRAEITRLRTIVRDCEHTVEVLKRENLQLKTKLLQNETSAQLNAQKHLFLLKNFNFDSLDF